MATLVTLNFHSKSENVITVNVITVEKNGRKNVITVTKTPVKYL